MERYLEQRARHIAEAQPGVAAARELAGMTDEAVRDLSRAASSAPRGRWALVALGGWGCGALQPRSDLDLLVLADARGESHKPFVEQILYPLWDAGLKVGHQTRTPKEQLRAMKDDTATLTAALTARAFAGDVEWASEVLADIARTVSKKPERAYAALAARERPGSPFLLEPQLKEGRGGRRDFDELTWSAAIAARALARDPSGLVAAGMLTADEYAELDRAAQTVARARWVLQRDGFGDTMTLEAAENVDDANEVQRALAITGMTLDRCRARLAGAREASTTPLIADELFALLDAGSPAIASLDDAAFAGRLDGLVAGLSSLMTLRRPGLGHQLTVGAHCITCAASVAGLGTSDGALGRSYETLARPRALQAAALTHDVGKRVPGLGHADRGAAPAREAALALGLSASEADDVADLVRLHLELVETALRTDIDDEDAILNAAARVGRRELVAPLHLLTAADSMATGPATWSPWVAALVASTASRIDAALSDTVDGAGLATRGEQVRAAALADVSQTDTAIREFIERASLRYLASREPSEVATHGRLLAALADEGAGGRARVAVSGGPTPDSYAVTVAAVDRPELFARVAGALALSGLDILAADAYRAGQSGALEMFVVTSATLRAVDTTTWQTFDRYLQAALRDRLELETRLQERRRHYRATSDVRTEVTTDASAGYHTVVRVTAADRPGLLYDLARAVSLSGMDIRWAKAVTVEGVAVDTFHVVGSDGGAVTDPGELGHLAMRVRDIG